MLCMVLLGSPVRGLAELTLYKEARPAMGTVFTIECYMPDRDSADRVLEAAFDEINRIEALLSNYQPTSELSRISRDAVNAPVVTDPETFRFLSRAMYWSRLSDGAFDITVGPLLRSWGFKARQGHVPTGAEQRLLRNQVGWERVTLDSTTHSVRIRANQAMELDPGSIGKGFAVDSVASLLREDGVSAAFISAGGSTLYGLGAPPGQTGWPVQIPDPRRPNTIAQEVRLRDSSLSTGACTEKYFVQNGHRYCHIFDPRTLMPVEGVLQSSVIAPSATDSDALSTVVFVLPPEQTPKVLERQPGTGAILFLSRPDAPSCTTFGEASLACPQPPNPPRKEVTP